MNSMFSSFDAFFYAEFLGQTVKASFPAQQQQKSTGTVLNNKASVADNLNGAKQEGNREASISMPQQAQPVKKKQSQKAPPRFALELDGLNCFETVVYH
ncbi:unnamed protein product [Prunus brigantina]